MNTFVVRRTYQRRYSRSLCNALTFTLTYAACNAHSPIEPVCRYTSVSRQLYLSMLSTHIETVWRMYMQVNPFLNLYQTCYTTKKNFFPKNLSLFYTKSCPYWDFSYPQENWQTSINFYFFLSEFSRFSDGFVTGIFLMFFSVMFAVNHWYFFLKGIFHRMR